MWLHSRKSRLISSFVSRILFAILGCLRPRPHVCGNFCIRKFFFFEFKNIFYSDFARWASAKSYVGAVLLTTFQGPRSIRHVDLSHPGKTGSDSVTSAYPISHCIQKFPLWRPNSKFSGYGNRIRRIRVDASRIRKKKHVGVVCTRERQRNMPNCKTHMRGVQKHCNC